MDIYEFLNQKIDDSCYEISQKYFSEEDRSCLQESDRYSFDLLRRISSVYIDIRDSGIEFFPGFVDESVFSIDHLVEKDYRLLESLMLGKLPLIIRVRIAEILWTKRKSFQNACIAAESYWELFAIMIGSGEKTQSIDMIRRSLRLSLQVKFVKQYEIIRSWLVCYLDEINKETDYLFALRIIEMFPDIKGFDVSTLLLPIRGIIQKCGDDYVVNEQAYTLLCHCYIKLNLPKEADNCQILLADFYVRFSNQLMHSQTNESFRASTFLQKAVFIFWEKGEHQKAEAAQRILLDVQKKIPQSMQTFSVEFDKSRMVEVLHKDFDSLSFKESIMRLSQIISFETIDELKGRVIERKKQYPLAHIFKERKINSQGQTVFILQPIDISDSEENRDNFEDHMHQMALERQRLCGDLVLGDVIAYIRQKYDINEETMRFLVDENGIIPDGREDIFLRGIILFLSGRTYEALHILAPQVENLFRNVAHEVGGITTTLEYDGTSKEKALSKVFALPELLDCYDNDIVFAFKGLLNDQAGANIRNNIAHGLISPESCNSGEYLFFGVAVIRLLTFTSRHCIKILCESERLKHFDYPEGEMVKLVKEK